MTQRLPSVCLLVLLGSSSFLGCRKQAETQTLARTAFAELGSLPDSELFKRNDGISLTLSQEIRRQLLAALSLSKGMFREINAPGNDIILSEIGIARGESKIMDFDVTADLKVAPKSTQSFRATVDQNGFPIPSGPAPLGANVATNYHVLTTDYTVSFGFEDKKSGMNGEMYRFALTTPLNLEENLKITSRAQLSLNAIAVLPKFLSTIVARFYQDIGANLNTGMSWERSAQLSTRMFYKATNNGITPLMTELMKDVIRPLCLRAVEARRLSKAACDITPPKIPDPLEDLSKRITTDMRVVKYCEATGLYENMLKIYKLYADLPEGSNAFIEGGKASLFRRVKGGWVRGIDKLPMASPWAKVLPGGCSGPAKGFICLPLRFGSVGMSDGTCQAINAGQLIVGVYNQDVPQVME